MAEIIKQGEGHRTHIRSPLMRESLMDRRVLAANDTEAVLPILPDVHVIHLGGASILDRGKAALVPLLDEIVECRKTHKIILGVGGGARMRHTYHVALDLGIPTGGLAMVAGAVNEQNRYMVQALLAKHGGVVLHKDHYVVLPLWLASGMIPIISGMPPYHYWEPPTGQRRVPHYREDFGLYTADPKKNPAAEFIPHITAAELLARDQAEFIIDRSVIESMIHARNTRRVQVINGLKAGLLTRAFAGERVGTLITAPKEV